jgi:hypothetical protein
MRYLPVICGALLALCAVMATHAAAQDFSGYGPLPVRNFQPIQLIFLNLPFERARVLTPYEFEVHIESAESNEIATATESLQATLKFETNRTVFGGSVGVGHGLEVGLDIPFISRFGGFLDPPLDAVEDFFGTSNPERRLFPDNSFGAFHVSRGNVVLFNGAHEQFEIGDLWLSGKYEVWHRPGLPLIALRGAVKAPTGSSSEVTGSGKPDVGVGVAVEHQFLSWLVAYSNLSVVFPVGPITPGHLTLYPFLTEGVAGEARLVNHLSLLLQQEMYTSPIHGTGTQVLDGTVVEFSGGLNFSWDPFLVQLAAIDNVSGVATAADFTLLLRLSYRR